MSKQIEFLKKQKILHLATIDKRSTPHIVPVWYMYSRNKIYVGTNTKTKKAKNIRHISIAPLFGKAIKAINTNSSVSALFD